MIDLEGFIESLVEIFSCKRILIEKYSWGEMNFGYFFRMIWE